MSTREEALAKELYEHDMGIHQAEDMPWEQQVELVKVHYLRLASKVVNTKWFKVQIDKAYYRGKNT